MELTFRLGAWMLVLGGAAETIEEGRARCEEAISSGAALERFYRNVIRQGGNVGEMLERRGSWRSNFARELKAENDGYIESIDALDIGLAGVYLGVGRNRTEDNVSPTAGFIFERKRGDLVKKGDRIAIAYGKDEESLDPAMVLAHKAVSISKEAPQPLSLVIEEITAP